MAHLPPYRIHFEHLSEDPEEAPLGQRSKLGGAPDWIQNDETPRCPHCKQKMMFVSQIDSINHDEEGNPHRIDCLSDEQRYMLGDVGMIYVFFCFDCCEPKSVFQCY